MAKAQDNTTTDAPANGAAGHSGSDVKQGMHGQARRSEARGRDEFQGNGESAALDEGRSEEAGRHPGRSGSEEPGPGYGRGPLQPAQGTKAHAESDGVDFDEVREPEADDAPTRTQGRHGEAPFAQGREAGQRKQMSPEEQQRGSAKKG